MAANEQMKRAKLAAKREFGVVDGVEGVGIRGDSALIVYIRDHSVASKIPHTFMGVLVETVVVGEINAGAAVKASA